MARPVAVIDCETDPFVPGRVPAPFLWCYFDGSEYVLREHDHLDGLIERIAAKEQVVYAHNGGRFDYMFLKRYIAPGQEIVMINGRLAKFKIGRAEFRDSLSIIPVALAKLQKDEIDYRLMEAAVRYKTENWRAIRDYIKSDCRYLHNIVMRFRSRYGDKLTQAGSAMAEWHALSGEVLEDSGEEFFDAFAPFYFGGRVECFKGGIIEQRFKLLDINGAYPHAMCSEHPKGLAFERAPKLLEGADFVRLTARSSGAFPFRDGLLGRLDFPADGVRREFCVSGWEYQAARDTGTLLAPRVLESCRFGDRRSFAGYIEKHTAERLAARAIGDRIGDTFAKLFMNSLYGKFAANPSRYKTYRVVDGGGADAFDWIAPSWEEGPEFEFVADLGGHWVVSKPLELHRRRYYNVATAASITGYVRAMLWRAICACGVGNVLYCDTDSLATHEAGGLELDANRRGAWKDEGTFKRAAIAGKKLYAFERVAPDDKGRRWKTASKGVQLNPRQILSAARGRTVTYRPQAPTFGLLHPPVFTARKIKSTIQTPRG